MEISVFEIPEDTYGYKAGIIVVITYTPTKMDIYAKLGSDYYKWDDKAASSLLLDINWKTQKLYNKTLDQLKYTGKKYHGTIFKMIFNEEYNV